MNPLLPGYYIYNLNLQATAGISRLNSDKSSRKSSSLNRFPPVEVQQYHLVCLKIEKGRGYSKEQEAGSCW